MQHPQDHLLFSAANFTEIIQQEVISKNEELTEEEWIVMLGLNSIFVSGYSNYILGNDKAEIQRSIRLIDKIVNDNIRYAKSIKITPDLLVKAVMMKYWNWKTTIMGHLS